MMSSSRGRRDAHRCPPEQRDRLGLIARVEAGEQVAEALAAGDPGGVHERSQPDPGGAVSQPGGAQPAGVQPGQAGPAGQGAGQRGGHVAAGRVMPAGDQAGPGERRGGQQRLVVAGQHRHRPGPPAAAHVCDDAAGAAGDVGAADRPQVGADQPGAGAQADQPGRPHPPRRRGLRGGEREVAVDLRRCIRGLGVLAGQRRVRRGQRGNDRPGQEPQVRAKRPPRHGGQPGRVRGEPLDHRRVQQHLRDRLQAQPGAPVREPARCPQQVLRPLPPARRGRGHHVPGEPRGLRRHRRPAATAGYTRRSHQNPYRIYTVRNARDTGPRLRK